MSYTGSSFSDLDKTKPDGAVENVAILDDAIRQIKRYLVDTLGDPAVSGSIFDAIASSEEVVTTPVGSVIPYSQSGTWTAPDYYLKCDGNTIGNVGSGATYQDADYETLFNIVKKSYDNAGTENWAGGDTVKLPSFSDVALKTFGKTITDVSSTTGNGGSKKSSFTGPWVTNTPTANSISLTNLTLGSFTLVDSLNEIDSLVLSLGFDSVDTNPLGNITSLFLWHVVDGIDIHIPVTKDGYTSDTTDSVNFLVPFHSNKTNAYRVDFNAFDNGSGSPTANFDFEIEKAVGVEAQTVEFLIRAK